MDSIVLSDLPGEKPGTGWAAYKAAADDLYQRCPSDRAYEDIMNGYAYLDKNGQVVYFECDDYFD